MENTSKALYDYLKKFDNCCFINEIFFYVQQENDHNTNKTNKIFKYILSILNLVIYMSITIGVIVFNLPFKFKIDNKKEIAITRVSREKEKIERVFFDLQYITDDIKNMDFSTYRIGKRRDRIRFIITKFIVQCFNEFKLINKMLSNKNILIDKETTLLWCAKRIPHTIIYKYFVELIISDYCYDAVYIGMTHERFAIIIENITKKYKKKLICVPHGIETTEKMPREYIGDTFFCSSDNIAKKLNDLYNTKKFIYDENITKKMLKIKNNVYSEEMKIVFFTMPLYYVEEAKSIIEEISKSLKSYNKKLYIKVHPNENNKDYIFENCEFISNFDEAIYRNICISIQSTALIEAIYNDSMAISIIHLVDRALILKGKHEFLNDDKILKPNSIKDMVFLLNKFIVESEN